ncbi:tyrosine-type recombinase/integrase [Prosthecobacter sp.]|uniref:tyrosine-type recombinase/integrase n=1 Tax=Prosthecobacter sp. TaxID=1965333 RepID=UPI00378517DC
MMETTTQQFPEKHLLPFYERSNSQQTRRAYKRVVREFFRQFQWRHPNQITSEQIRGWRDQMTKARRKPATVSFKLAVVRSLYEYLREEGFVTLNPATVHKVPPPVVSEELRGRALTVEEVRLLLAGPDRSKVEGARDYALLLLLVRTSMRIGEACGLQQSSLVWSHGRWLLRFRVKGGRERKLPIPKEVKTALDEYLKLDRKRRGLQHTDHPESAIFQPLVNYRTLEYDKPLSTTQAWKIVRKWAEFTGIGKLSPHDLRRTAITRALDQGLSYRQVRMMSGHKSVEMVVRYDHQREKLEYNAVNFLVYEEQPTEK